VVQLEILTGGFHSVRIVVGRDNLGSAERVRSEREDAGTGTDVEHAQSCDRFLLL